MQSYPNCNGFDRVLKEPDARQLAEISEELGLDFQIVLLTRFPDSVLVSTTIKRRFGPNLEHQAHFYNYILDILLAQLESLDSRFLSGCINIETNQTEAKRLLTPLRQRIDIDDAKLDTIFRHWSTRSSSCIAQTQLSKNWTTNLVQLYRKSLLMEYLCEQIIV